MPQIFDGHADRVTRQAEDWKVTVFDRLEALPADAIALFPNAIVGNLFDTRHWYRCIIEAAVPGSAQPVLVLCTRAGQSIALLPLLRMDDGALQSLTTPYTCLYQPLLHPNADIEIFRQVGRIFGHFCRRYGPVRIEAMDVNWPGLPSLLSGIHAAGLMALRFPVAPIKRIDGFFLDSQTKDAFVAKASGQWVQPFDIYQFFCNQFPQA